MNAQNIEKKPTVKRETKNKIRVEFDRTPLKERLKAAKLPIVDIAELKEKAERITGKPTRFPKGDRVVAEVIGREGNLQDVIYNVLDNN